jgi:D-threo-aldose 1-dehydrogenase
MYRIKIARTYIRKRVWFDLKHDVIQIISYEGIIEYFNQGNELHRETYKPQLLSVHDPENPDIVSKILTDVKG